MEPSRTETQDIRKIAETIRRELRAYERRGGNLASFLPRVKRARRLVRRHEADKALVVLQGLETDLRERL